MAAFRELHATRYAEQIAWLQSLRADEVSAMRGAANRCGNLIEGDGGEVLLPVEGRPQIDFLQALRGGGTVHLPIDVQAYPELGPQIIAWMLGALSVTAGTLRAANQVCDALVCVDEAGALRGSHARPLLERCADVGIRTWWSPQSLAAVAHTMDEPMRDALVDNCNLVLAHRQSAPEAAELLAQIAGTEEQLEHTHLVDGFGPMGFDEPGQRARRLTEEFRAHPNRIKGLQRGQVLLIEKDRGVRTRFVQMRGLEPLPAVGRDTANPRGRRVA